MNALEHRSETAHSAFVASEVSLELEHARLVAQTQLEDTRSKFDSDFGAIRLARDSISSARRYVQESTEENLSYVNKDAYFTFIEALSARTTTIPPDVRYRWMNGDFWAGGQSLTSMAANCLYGHDATDMEVSEFVLAVLPSELYRKGHEDKVIRTISYPDKFGVDTQLMIRDFRFEEVEGGTDLVSQQLTYVGDNLTPRHIELLQGAIGGTQIINDERLQTYIVDSKDADSLTEIGIILDAFIGEEVAGGRHSSVGREKYYEDLVAKTREISTHAARLAPSIGVLSIKLAERKVRPEFSNIEIKDEVDRLAHELSRRNPEIALFAFGEEVADLYRMADEAELRGDIEGANYIRGKAQEAGTLICEAGSCGLEVATDKEVELAHSLGLKGEVLTLKERACPSCKQSGGVLVDEKGNMACSHCKESNLTVKQKQAARSDDE